MGECKGMGKRLGFPVLYGDGCRPAVLESAGIPRPLMAIVVYSGRQQSVSSVESLHNAFPGLPIYARAVDASHLAELRKAGATDVVLESAEAGLRLGSMLLQDMGVMRDDVVFLRRLMREALDTEAVNRRTGQRLLKDRSDLGGSWPAKEENLGGKRAAKEDLGGSRVGKEGEGGRGEESDREGDSSGDEKGEEGGGKVRGGEDGEKVEGKIEEGRKSGDGGLAAVKNAGDKVSGSDGLITRAQAIDVAVGFVSEVDEKGDAGNNGDDGDGDGDGDDGDGGDTGAATPAEGSDVLITRAQALNAAAAFVTSDDDIGDVGTNGNDGDDTGGDGVLEVKGEQLEEAATSRAETAKTVSGSFTGTANVKDGNFGLERVSGSGESDSDLEGSGSDGVGGESSFSASDDGLQYFSDGEDFIDMKLGCNSSSGGTSLEQ
ncbi:unnamed protein product [Closterium sp. NIES-64]|nr:unnamed protein product [Closterium sp. NIES-64]